MRHVRSQPHAVDDHQARTVALSTAEDDVLSLLDASQRQSFFTLLQLANSGHVPECTADADVGAPVGDDLAAEPVSEVRAGR